MLNEKSNCSLLDWADRRSEKELREIALSFISDCRVPQSIFEHAAELESLGAHGAKIPPMRAHLWKAIIDGLITAGKLIEVNGCVVAPVVVDGLKQMTLF